jgi:uncharacterized membrane protein YhhN
MNAVARWQPWLPWLAALSAGLTIASASGALPAWLAFAFKPLTTLLVIAHAWPRGGYQPRQRQWIRIGLLLSLLGDVFLLWPQQGFLPGLVSFLLAHLAYIAAFSVPLRFGAGRLPFALYAAIAALILLQLWPGIQSGLRVPVLAYVVCLACMAAQAAAWWRASAGLPTEKLARSAALGGVLFMVSDSLLAFNKFAASLPLSALWILLSYWLAQWCIANSLAAETATHSRA